MTQPQKNPRQQTIGLLLIGGIHHILHLIPVAVGLEEETDATICIYVTSETEKQACRSVLVGLGSTRTTMKIIKPHPLSRFLSPKKRIILSNIGIWNNLDALIVAERTSTVLRRFSKRLPPFIHIPHGAGDRAKSYDPRIKLFDHVLVAGAKDKERMIALGLVEDQTCHVTGYIKPYAVKRIASTQPKLFNNSKPVVLYNPHFDETLSSWVEFGRDLLKAFARHPEKNFIVAPHIRLFKNQDTEQKAAIEVFSKYENIHVDLGSDRSCDMTYTRAADIYLGDVSSQVYEFLSEPKSCIFLTNLTTQWKDNPDYAHWRYGPICHSVSDVMTAIARAPDDLAQYESEQRLGCLAATGDPSWNPVDLAAKAVKSILNHG